MKTPLISVIVPVYKVEKYLSKCVDSILNQTYTNLEIWLVDDGSPDNSGKICDEWADRDSRIRVIHKENGGLSDARNVALDQITGGWVTFIDSDDTVTVDYIERLMLQAEETGADVVVTNWNIFPEGDKPADISSWKEQRKVFTWKEALITMMYQRDFDTAACVKLYDAKLFKTQRFPVGWISEDLATIYKILLKSKTVAWNNYPCYNYLLRCSSIEGSGFSECKYNSYMEIIKMFEKDMTRLDNDIRKAFRCRIVSLLFHILLVMPNEEKERVEHVWQMLKHYRMGVLFDRHARPKARAALLLSFGGKICIKIFGKYGSYR